MGAQQVLRAIAASVLIFGIAEARHRGSAAHERVAIIDLGPADDGRARAKIGAAVVAAGMAPVIDDGIDDALAGISRDTDELSIAAELASAKQAFGELDCKTATASARQAIGGLAARQAAGLPVPELPRAWAYVLLCADRNGETGAALIAAARIRALAGAQGSVDVPASVLAKYPDIDAVADRDMFEVEITADVPGAAVWVDFQPAGTAPAKLQLTAGEHVIAAASGTRRGFISGTAVRKQKQVAIPMPDRASTHAALAAKIAGWHGQMPSPAELAPVLAEVHARVGLVRHGDVIEVWGHAGLAEPLRRLGGDDGVRSLAETDRAVALAADRVQTWNDRAPDPDQPLLTEAPGERARRRNGALVEEPAKWWVYAAIGGAIIAGAAIVYAKNSAGDTQRVELHYP